MVDLLRKLNNKLLVSSYFSNLPTLKFSITWHFNVKYITKWHQQRLQNSPIEMLLSDARLRMAIRTFFVLLPFIYFKHFNWSVLLSLETNQDLVQSRIVLLYSQTSCCWDPKYDIFRKIYEGRKKYWTLSYCMIEPSNGFSILEQNRHGKATEDRYTYNRSERQYLF